MVIKKNNSYRVFMRALNGTLSDTAKEYHLGVDFKSTKLFRAKAIMEGVMATSDYKKSVAKQARACNDEEYAQIMNLSVVAANGSIDDFLLTAKSGFIITTGFCIRGDEVHRALDEDLIFGVDDDGFKYIDLKIYYDKSRSSCYHKAIFCDEIGSHHSDKFNGDACPVA
eukprot:UN08220